MSYKFNGLELTDQDDDVLAYVGMQTKNSKLLGKISQKFEKVLFFNYEGCLWVRIIDDIVESLWFIPDTLSLLQIYEKKHAVNYSRLVDLSESESRPDWKAVYGDAYITICNEFCCKNRFVKIMENEENSKSYAAGDSLVVVELAGYGMSLIISCKKADNILKSEHKSCIDGLIKKYDFSDSEPVDENGNVLVSAGKIKKYGFNGSELLDQNGNVLVRAGMTEEDVQIALNTKYIDPVYDVEYMNVNGKVCLSIKDEVVYRIDFKPLPYRFNGIELLYQNGNVLAYVGMSWIEMIVLFKRDWDAGFNEVEFLNMRGRVHIDSEKDVVKSISFEPVNLHILYGPKIFGKTSDFTFDEANLLTEHAQKDVCDWIEKTFTCKNLKPDKIGGPYVIGEYEICVTGVLYDIYGTPNGMRIICHKRDKE